MKSVYFCLLVLIINFGTVQMTLAAQPYNPNLVTNGNLWRITGYRDAHFAHQWQTPTWNICFEIVNNPSQPCYDSSGGMEQTVYQWTSNYPGWGGCAVQEGDQIFMNGNYGNGSGNDSMEWEIVTLGTGSTLGTGHWREWQDNHTYDFFGNAKFERFGFGTCLAISGEKLYRSNPSQ